ncbi:MAG: DUF4625 domain-containing protein [Tangfeifania sp.]
MKTKFTAILLAAGILSLNSCKKEEEIPNPEVTITELGYENSKIGYAGSDLHIEAEIVAEGRIDKVIVEIHHEGEHDNKSALVNLHDNEWEVDTTYTRFSGLKNVDNFHEHIEIPVYAEIGDYHFHFIVSDMEGNQTTVEEELEIQQPDDNVAPEVNVTAAPSDDQVFNNAETISISGSVSDDKALGGMYIGLVRADQNLTDAEVNASNTITILHTHDFDSPTSHDFSASINVGATHDNNIAPKDITGEIAWQSANYYILVKCKDAFGGNWSFSDRYPIEINY